MSDRTRSVMRRAVPAPSRLALPVLLGVASAGSTIALLACSAWLIARAAEQPPVLYLQLGIVGVRAFALGRAVFRYLERLTGHDASFRQLASIRAGIFERMLPLAPDGLRTSRRGELLARFVGDVDELQNVTLRAVQPVVSAVLVLIAAVTALAMLAPAAAVAVGAVLAIGLLVALLAERAAAGRAERSIAPLRGALQAAVVDHVQALDVLVAFDAASDDRARIRAIGANLERATRTRSASAGAAAAVVTAIGGFATLASLLVAWPALAAGGIDGPEFAVLCLVPLAIAEVAGAIPIGLAAWRVARVSAARVADAVPDSVPPEIPVAPANPLAGSTERQHDGRPDSDRSGAAPGVRDAPPAITLTSVGAAWPGGPAVLEGLDLELAPGERLLVQGESGSGKTTLAHVLVRFLEYRGSYRLDGVEARTLDPAEVRRTVGLVEQRPWLFDEDIRQNLLFARPAASDEELLEVLDRVGLADWVAERGGLDARVGERGALVSGGQAQRIALARAMLAQFPVLVLDEPTANVDPDRADALLTEMLGAAGPERSVVLIAHAGVDPALVDRRLEIGDGRAVVLG
ncbi:thiol reductant ABC exporter subunit CydC [Agromyces badenianii]|uniref:Thiol reductant ABC exporter subunit CydC n=1 Tax=Agromyces badenianii TaxID=2080742 RepID=A0A2S0WVM3_9MICO|nr:thiol reductant ABC exporter subunit CydC [Agromyces badenianii]AWB95351.1 thiol reductant ABC exporter subunit CydC [Agromyces badenianii]